MSSVLLLIVCNYALLWLPSELMQCSCALQHVSGCFIMVVDVNQTHSAIAAPGTEAN